MDDLQSHPPTQIRARNEFVWSEWSEAIVLHRYQDSYNCSGTYIHCVWCVGSKFPSFFCDYIVCYTCIVNSLYQNTHNAKI